MFEIGNSLREARLRRQMEFAEAEHGTKIRGKYLRALEDERFELLPSHTYVKGFLRSYAEYLGLDGQLYVDEYNSRYVTSGEEDAPMRATRRVPAAKARRSERRESNIVLLALTSIGVVTALVIVAWRFGGVEGDPVRGLTTPQQQQVPAPQATGLARLELRATRGDSYMIVRSGSSQGEVNVLYKGTLERNQKKRVRQHGAVAQAREAGERPRQAERQSGDAAEEGGQGAGRLRDGEEGLRRRRPLTAGARPRAVVVVTGSELVRGERTDLNGPFLARSLLALGLEPARIEIVGDDPAELEAAIREAVGSAELVACSGGLGTDPRRPHGRGGGARGRAAAHGRRGARGPDREPSRGASPSG